MTPKVKTMKWIAATTLLALRVGWPGQAEAQFRFVTNNGALTVTAFTGFGGAVVVPGATNGYPVTSIGNGASVWCAVEPVRVRCQLGPRPNGGGRRLHQSAEPDLGAVGKRSHLP